ncbi:MAG: helix-turn-helix transcriptional regulator [Alphaproteobacteria bacterium]
MNRFWTPGDTDLTVMPLDAVLPPAPNLVRSPNITWFDVVFDRAAITPLMPPGLEPLDSVTGGFMAYETSQASGMSPYTCSKAWIHVKGYDGPDGRPAGFFPVAYFPGPFRQRLLRTWNDRVSEGGAREERRGDIVTSTGGLVDEDHMRLTVQELPDDAPITSGILHMIGEHSGDLAISRIPYVGRFRPARPVGLDILASSGHPLHQLRPVDITAAWRLSDLSFTHGFISQLSDGASSAEAVKGSLLKILAHFGRGALVVAEDRRVLYANTAAAELLGSGAPKAGQRLRLGSGREQAAVDSLIAESFNVPPSAQRQGPVLVTWGGDERKLMIEAVGVDQEDEVRQAHLPFARRVVILLVTDPERPVGKVPVAALRLLGLIPSEARIAALVGGGMSPREAAADLGLSEGTVRTTLVRIYDKLSIRRQSELARMVAHLGLLGG